MTVEPDPIFAHPRLAAIYDLVDDDRSDLDHYEAIVTEFGAGSVLDVGCGTGSLAVRLAQCGIDVTGVDPAAASLDVARSKPGADHVTWICGTVSDVSPTEFDLVVMTGNVAQVFVSDDAWRETLRLIRDRLAPHGRLVFETRDPAQAAWEDWTSERSFRSHDIDGVGSVETWVETLAVSPPIVRFRWTYRFAEDGVELTSDSTLRFRSLDEIGRSLEATGYRLDDVRDAPDRPGKEFVVLATGTGGTHRGENGESPGWFPAEAEDLPGPSDEHIHHRSNLKR